MNPINIIAQTEIIKTALQKYNSYGSEWQKAYFDKLSGGYVVVDKQRIENSKINNNEKEKFAKEYAMSRVFAQNGYRIEILMERPGFSSSDITINGIMAELKKTSSHNNMLKYAKKAIDKQGAKLVIFEFDKDTKKIQEELDKLKRMNIKVYYYFTGNKQKIHIL